jgi:hypothetical protein
MKTIAPLLAFLAMVVMVYLSIAFVVWDLNPSNWRENTRAVAAFVGIPFGVAVAFFVKGEQL